MDLSIILVNYKSPQLVLDCVESIYHETKAISFEIIVVDNFSEDNSQDVVLSRFPRVQWIAMSYNAGFARANNEGIRQSSGRVVLLLNSDTVNEDNAIERCFELFKASE